MQLKTTDDKYPNVIEPILDPEYTVMTIQSQISAVNAVTRLVQPSDVKH